MATRIGVREPEGPRIIVDCTHTYHTGAYTGIQRVVRNFADALVSAAPARGVRIVPARVAGGDFVPLERRGDRVAFPTSLAARESEGAAAPTGPLRRLAALRRIGHGVNRVLRSARLADWLEAGPNADGLARRMASASLRTPPPPPGALPVEPTDIVLSLDSSWVYDIRTPLEKARAAGATCVALLCDVLPLSHPQWFTAGTRHYFRGWLEALLPRVHAILAISAASCRELGRLVESGALDAPRRPCRPVRLGAEIASGAPGEVREALRGLLAAGRPPALLTVGTLEPRKNVEYALDLFDELRAQGLDLQWHIVGAPGWMHHGTAARIHGHPELGKRLLWWADLRDAELDFAYRHAAALVAVSYAEGFGLPLVEARLHGLPVFASDIAVFREVLGDEGRYLPLGSPKLAAAALEDFLRRPEMRRLAARPSRVALQWTEAAAELLDTVLAVDREARGAAA